MDIPNEWLLDFKGKWNEIQKGMLSQGWEYEKIIVFMTVIYTSLLKVCEDKDILEKEEVESVKKIIRKLYKELLSDQELEEELTPETYSKLMKAFKD